MYTLYIDESGQTEINKVRTEEKQGASPYMALGGVIVPDVMKEDLRGELSDILRIINKQTLHCQRMKHRQKVFYARRIAQKRVQCFGVISKKETLGRYKDDIAGNNNYYYNKCTQYLLERVGAFMKENEISPENLKICFEEGEFDYEAMRGLLAKCQRNPKHPNTHLLRHIDIANINIVPKANDPLLQIADLVAYSLFMCVDKSNSNFGIPETRYLNELRKKFYHHTETNRIERAGIYAIHDLGQLDLDDDVFEFMNNLKAI